MPASSILSPLLNTREAAGLSEFLKSLEGHFAGYSASKTGFLARLTDYVMTGSGKRLRPALVYVASRFGTARETEVMEAAIAVEMIHISTLVHDDLVDQAFTRRKKPTVGVQFGDGAAVLLGDFVYAEAFRRLAALGRPGLLNLFAEATAAMCEGEIGQYEARFAFDLTEEDYIAFLRKKTASLMAAAARAGGELAGLSGEHLTALEDFGNTLGVAFQIADDVLDVTGDESVVGKTLHTDLINGKMTLPLILARRTLSPSEQRNFQTLLKNPNGHLNDLIATVVRSSVMDECRDRTHTLLAQAEQALGRLPDHPARSLLFDVARRLSDRKL